MGGVGWGGVGWGGVGRNSCFRILTGGDTAQTQDNTRRNLLPQGALWVGNLPRQQQIRATSSRFRRQKSAASFIQALYNCSLLESMLHAFGVRWAFPFVVHRSPAATITTAWHQQPQPSPSRQVFHQATAQNATLPLTSNLLHPFMLPPHWSRPPRISIYRPATGKCNDLVGTTLGKRL